MNIAVAVCVFYMFILANCGLSQTTKRLRGEYDYTKEFKEKITKVSDKNKQNLNSLGDVVQSNKAGSLKPCYQHLQRLRKNKPYLKAFIPLCAIDGYYAPLQCHSGYCWCSDRLGNQKNGTRVKGFTTYCDLQSVKRPCKRHRSRALSHGRSIGTTGKAIFIPRCHKNGYYLPLQCLARNKQCWCVDEQGKEKKGTRTRGITKCEYKDISITEVVDWFSVPDKHPNDYPCLRHKKKIRKFVLLGRRNVHVYNPNCDKDGMYDKKQCHRGTCWCADREGKRIKGSSNKGSVECGAFFPPKETRIPSGPTRKDCTMKRREAIRKSLSLKLFIPLCDSSGNYAPLQCDVNKGYCWCVDRVGKIIPNTKTKRTPNCFSKVIRKSGKGPCHLYKWYIQNLPTTNFTYIPRCKKNGFFQQKQCSHNRDYCWCVDHVGREIKKTLTFGILRCPNDKPLNLTDVFTSNKPARTVPCIQQRKKAKHMASKLRLKLFYPTCDKNGNYNAKQCYHGICWCVNSDGSMMPETRKKGDINCDVAMVSKKDCHTERREAQEDSMFSKKFVPLCEPNGKYSPVQCDMHKGECWCVNQEGKRIPGSNTKRTPNCFSSVFNTIQDGPCHVLQSYINKLPFTEFVNKPKCEANGFFQPSQCNTDKNKSYCWCVMHDGTEIVGSIMFGKPRCHEKPAPAVPKERGPCEDHLYHIKNLASDREVYTPVCDENGFFVPLQCNNLTGYCWCADRYGVAVRGTRTKGTPVCGEKALKPCNGLKKKDEEYTPVYTEDGYFAPMQCNVKRGNCWCVDKMGVKEPGTSIYQRPYCGTEKRSCELQRRLLLSTNQTETFVPSCDLHGYYSTIQCEVSNDECWCSDREGNEILGSRTKETPECGQIPKPCDEHASRTSNYDYIFGVYVPQCDSKGYYKSIQCHEITNICWCSSKIGVEIPGTKTTGRPNCSEKRISR